MSNLEEIRGGRSHILSEQPVLMFDHCYGKKFLIYLIRISLLQDASVAKSVSILNINVLGTVL